MSKREPGRSVRPVRTQSTGMILEEPRFLITRFQKRISSSRQLLPPMALRLSSSWWFETSLTLVSNTRPLTARQCMNLCCRQSETVATRKAESGLGTRSISARHSTKTWLSCGRTYKRRSQVKVLSRFPTLRKLLLIMSTFFRLRKERWLVSRKRRKMRSPYLLMSSSWTSKSQRS